MKEDVGLVYNACMHACLGDLGSTLLGALFWFILVSIPEVKNYGLANYYIAARALRKKYQDFSSPHSFILYLVVDAVATSYDLETARRIID